MPSEVIEVSFNDELKLLSELLIMELITTM
jgi:hypothetical protein